MADKDKKSRRDRRLLKDPNMNKKAKERELFERKKKQETTVPKIFDVIEEIIKTPYYIRGGKAKGGRAGYRGGGRTRLLEELGRVEAEPSNRNRRAEISRVHSELNKGYKSGGAVLKGKKVGCQIK
jgi:hypothetical protein|tara:strand:+ start:115 stop:492 length:378 start_codon:yes stop_codon:yes gene_type:complete